MRRIWEFDLVTEVLKISELGDEDEYLLTKDGEDPNKNNLHKSFSVMAVSAVADACGRLTYCCQTLLKISIG